MIPHDPGNTLTDDEKLELSDLMFSWRAAHEDKDWLKADSLRNKLQAWGAWPANGLWHSWFEDGEHRQARLAKRGTG